jgi:RDD family
MRLANTLKRQGVRVLCLSRDSIEVTRDYCSKNGISLPDVLADPADRTFTQLGLARVPNTVLEAQRSGIFRWRYEQESGVRPDGADAVLILVNLTVMFLYFVIPLARRRQTVGQWVFSLVTVSAGGSVQYLPFSTALWRRFMAFRGLVSPWRFLKETDVEGRTWYDRETDFTVVRF